MSATKFFELSNEELNNKLNELKAELFSLRFKHATNQLSNPMVLVNCKRDIARVKTVIRQRELGISEQTPKATAKKKAAK
ncbi:MAG: 50S ribosomal protein L29 [Christensenellales bacterium]|jgi:large subunit ribosomal protein L29